MVYIDMDVDDICSTKLMGSVQPHNPPM